MKLLIFTLLLSFLSVSSLFAETREWNISSDEFNALGTLTAPTTVNGLTIYATADKSVVVEPNGKELDGMVFTTRMKLGGAGSIAAGAEYRVVSIDVSGNATISVAAISSSSSTDREMLLINGNGDTLSTKPVLGAEITMVVYDYVGPATKLYLASQTSGINLYYIKAEDVEGGVATKEIVFVKSATTQNDSIVIASIQARPEFNVTVIEQNVITEDLLAQFNAADVVIMGRSINSSDAGSGKAVWDAITSPVLSMNMWAMRGQATKCFWTPSTSCANMKNDAGVFIEGTILVDSDPVFEGMTGTMNWWSGNYSIFGVDAEGDDAGNGTLLAKTPDGSALFMRWAAGEMYPGGAVAAGERSYIGNGSDDGGVINYFAFSATAEKIFFNELERLAFGAVIPNNDGSEAPAYSDPYAIFDPSEADTTMLPDGMTIVELDGKKYAQLVLNGWESSFPVPAFSMPEGMTHFTVSTKYGGGVSGFDAVNTFLKMVDNSADAWAELAASGEASTTDFITRKVAIATKGTITNVQIAGQETTSWGAVVGDTVWIGKIRAYFDEADVIMNPMNIDPATSDKVSMVVIGGKKYAQIVLDGWNSTIPVLPFDANDSYTDFSVEAKYAVGTSGYALSNINTFLKIADSRVTDAWVELAASGVPSTAEFKLNTVKIATPGICTVVQIAGQEKTGWSAVSGDTLWLGKVTAIASTPPDPNVIIDPATFGGALGDGWSIVDIDGTKYFKVALNGWSSWTNVPAYTFPAGKNAFQAAVKYEIGTSGAALENIGAFLKFSTPDWAEIGASRSPASATFKEQVVTLAANEGNIAGVLQVAGQDAANGYSAVVGDFMYIGKIMAVTTAPITFRVDDSKFKSYDGFVVRGSWMTESGLFDSGWNGGADHFELTDSVNTGDTENPVWVVDNIWEHTVNLVADGGANIWKWGFLDLAANWLAPSPDPEFTVTDWTPQTVSLAITTGVKDYASQLKIFPNPVENVLNVSGREIESISIYNMTGAKVQSSHLSNNSVDVSTLAKGTYLLKVIDMNGETAISRFTKK